MEEKSVCELSANVGLNVEHWDEVGADDPVDGVVLGAEVELVVLAQLQVLAAVRRPDQLLMRHVVVQHSPPTATALSFTTVLVTLLPRSVHRGRRRLVRV